MTISPRSRTTMGLTSAVPKSSSSLTKLTLISSLRSAICVRSSVHSRTIHCSPQGPRSILPHPPHTRSLLLLPLPSAPPPPSLYHHLDFSNLLHVPFPTPRVHTQISLIRGSVHGVRIVSILAQLSVARKRVGEPVMM